MLFYLKKAYYFFLEKAESLLDSISSRLCFFCKESLGSLICDDCLEAELSLKKKLVDYRVLDHYFARTEQVSHPKIYYLFNFFKKTSYLIKKAKYTRPYFAKFFAKLLSSTFVSKVNTILNEDLLESFIDDLPKTQQNLNFYISYTPMHQVKEKGRSFNFAKVLAESFYKNLLKTLSTHQEIIYQGPNGLKKYQFGKVVFLEQLFIRDKNTKALFNLGQESRMQELKDAFVINDEKLIENADLNILLIIDDICTTGSTLMELMKLSRLKSIFDDEMALSIYGRNLK